MPETTPPPIGPRSIEIGATPLYVPEPFDITVDGNIVWVSEINLKGYRLDPKNPAGPKKGPEHALILIVDQSQAGEDPKVKPLQGINIGETVPWDSVYGLAIFQDDPDKTIFLPRDYLSLTPPAPGDADITPQMDNPTPEPEPAPVVDVAVDTATQPPETPPTEPAAHPAPPAPPAEAPRTPTPPALTELQRRASEPPKSISLIGLDVDQMIQLRASKDVQKLNETKNIITKIWKGNIAHELMEEHAYQFRKKQVEAAQMMLSDETIATIETRAKAKYEKDMRLKNRFGRAWTQFKDAVARNVGLYTTQENLAVAEAGIMRANNELSNITEYENNLNAIRARYEEDFVDSDGVIRKNLGESLDILKFDDPATSVRHKAIVDGIKDMVHNYANGTYRNKAELDSAMTAFAKVQKIGVNSKDFREAQVYASSLFRIAEAAKTRVESGVALSAIDAELDKMEIRVGRAQMGEATQFERSQTRKNVEWLMQRNIFGAVLTNEASVGTAVAIGITLSYVPRTFASSVARLAGGAAGGGAVAGVIAGFKENARMKREYFTYIRERESGGGLPQAGDKLRSWMQAREMQQTDASELINRMVGVAYKDGLFRQDLSGDDLTKTLAYLADAKARRAVSARGGENISVIRWGATVDVGRANLDLSIDKLDRDLKGKFGISTQFNGQTVDRWTKTLTDVQIKVLTDGKKALDAYNDPIKIALGEVSDNAPSIKILRRKFIGLAGSFKEKGSAEGVNAALREVKTAIRFEATRRGVAAGAIGTTIGTLISEIGHLGIQEVQTGVQDAHAIGGYVNDILHGTVQHVHTHLVEVPGISPVPDAQGLTHILQTQIPDNTQLIADPAHHAFNLAYTDGTTIMHGIHIDATGKILDTEMLNKSPEAIIFGLHFGNADHLVATAGHAGGVTSGGGFDISTGPGDPAHAMGGNGEWDWMVHNMNADQVHSVVPATNLTAKLLHYYETNITHNSNVDIAQIPGYHRVVHYLTDGQGNQTINYNSMPDNMWFHNLPDNFRPENQAVIGHTMDHAMDLYHKVLAGAPEHGPSYPGWQEYFNKMESSGDPNGHLYALMYKVGYVDKPLTSAEYTELMHLLSGPAAPPTELLTHTGIIDQNYGVEILRGIDVIPTPVVAPLPRTGMRPGTPAVPSSPLNPEGYYYGETPFGNNIRIRDILTRGDKSPISKENRLPPGSYESGNFIVDTSEGSEAILEARTSIENADKIYVLLDSGPLGDATVGTAYFRALQQALKQLGRDTPITLVVNENYLDLFKLFEAERNIKIITVPPGQGYDKVHSQITTSPEKNPLIFDVGQYRGTPTIVTEQLNGKHVTSINNVLRAAIELYNNDADGLRRYGHLVEELFSLPHDSIDPNKAQTEIVLPPQTEKDAIYAGLVTKFGIHKNKPQIAIVSESSSHGKRYSMKNWLSVIKDLSARDPKYEFNIVINPNNSPPGYTEQEILQLINSEGLARKVRIVNGSLLELAVLFEKQRLVMSNDTGLGHIAGAIVNGPQVLTVFMPKGPPANFWISSPKQQAIELSQQVQSSLPHVDITESDENVKNINKISPSDVADRASQLL